MTAPTYWLSYDDRPGYLLARVQGLTDSLETSISFWQEIALEARERAAQRLLVQESFRNGVNAAETADLCQFLAELFERLGLQNLRVAFLDEQLSHLAENQHAERTATDYGLCVKVFAELDDAERWLLAE